MKKQIVMFSGGASSSYLAYLVAKEYGKENTILLHTPTYAEDPDADRFRTEVAEFLGLPITVEEDGRDLWKCIEDNKCLPSFHIPFCTTELKIKQSRKFFRNLENRGIDFVAHFGYGADEWRRVQKQSVRLEVEGIKSKYLNFERKIADKEIKRIIQEEWRIELPRTYKYLKHNNCIPCFKGGKGHFKQVAKYYPNEFNKAMKLEEKIGHTVFKDCTLQDIWKEVQSTKNQVTFFDDMYGIPCMCMD
ncbi:hypothetical protein NE686_18010 [Tissierella carlieri]|uniref:Phosphoadenosine phosphosulphate reductase domain-containing protein n=1 Tax=Tissierella carlieri TaxID=689904 RepID=A0ABT1SEU4_9FIRM|nr:hypothetical protein [Tissierella carlieri]MCQ4925001.1 hypothetical protein [Tissierella carlieri]